MAKGIVIHRQLTWHPIQAGKRSGVYYEAWECSEYPGMVLTWFSKDSVNKAGHRNNFPFSGFNKNLDEMIEKWKVIDAKVND